MEVSDVWDVASGRAIRIVPVGASDGREVAYCFDGTGGRVLCFVFSRPRMKRYLVELFESRGALRTAPEIHFDRRDIVLGRGGVDSTVGNGKNELRLLKLGRMALRYDLDALFIYSIQVQLAWFAARVSFILLKLFKLRHHGQLLARLLDALNFAILLIFGSLLVPVLITCHGAGQLIEKLRCQTFVPLFFRILRRLLSYSVVTHINLIPPHLIIINAPFQTSILPLKNVL